MTVERTAAVTAPGVYDIAAAEYFALDALNASTAWMVVSRSPLHAWTDSPRNPDWQSVNKRTFDVGTAAHHMVLRQDFWRDGIVQIDAESYNTKAARTARDEAYDCGLTPILRDQYGALERMVAALEQHPQASRAFTNGNPERSLIWRDAETGLLLKCRPDWIPNVLPSPFPDFKSTQDANPHTWDRRFCLDHSGLLRAAWYAEGFRNVFEIDKPTLYYVVQEIAPPYAISIRVVEHDSTVMRIGRALMRKAVWTWAQCIDSGKFPSYPLIGRIEAPQWAADRYDVELADYMAPRKREAFMPEALEAG